MGSSRSSLYMGSSRSSSHMGSSRSRPTCQVYGKLGHSVLIYYNRFNQAYQVPGPNLTAYNAMATSSQDLNWYPDTGASYHVTFDSNQLNIQSEEYDGPDQIKVGNGTRLAIKYIGTSLLSQPNFILRNVLHVPKITKNLLSVQKFTLDNNAFMEFYPSCFFVKDCIFGKILHKGSCKNGLYQWPPSTLAAPPRFFPVNIS
jgi:hypothetical protein